MDRDEKYSFISVNSGDDDEIVIQTGAVQAARDEQVTDDSFAGADVSEQSDDSDAVPESELEHAIERESSAPTSSASTKKYETTREDLESVEPMSKMQKIVIACALLFVVGFAAYYIFLR